MLERLNTVQELIDELTEIKDKTKPVFIYDSSNSEIYPVHSVDNTISDRVDINIDNPIKTAGGRKVNRMIFLEREEIDEDTFDFLNKNNVLERLDYGNTELSSDMFKNLVENFNDFDRELKNGEEITLKQLREGLGIDVADSLIRGELDFVQIIYD